MQPPRADSITSLGGSFSLGVDIAPPWRISEFPWPPQQHGCRFSGCKSDLPIRSILEWRGSGGASPRKTGILAGLPFSTRARSTIERLWLEKITGLRQKRFDLPPSNGPNHFSSDLRLPLLRLSRPTNQRLVSVDPNMRRSLSRRSAVLRNLHEQFVGIVQPINGRRGAWRSR
jgi:hypothetical protein